MITVNLVRYLRNIRAKHQKNIGNNSKDSKFNIITIKGNIITFTEKEDKCKIKIQ